MSTPLQASAGSASRLRDVDLELFTRHNGPCYRTPTDLQVTPTPGARFLVVGGCLAQPLAGIASLLDKSFRGDFLLLNNYDSFPEIPGARSAEYDFQVIHIPLRSVFGNAYFHLPDDGSQHGKFLRETKIAWGGASPMR
jgi:hypothetical protein